MTIENIWIFISLLVVVVFLFKFGYLNFISFLDDKVDNVKFLINEAKRTFDDAESRLEKSKIRMREFEKDKEDKIAKLAKSLNNKHIDVEKEIDFIIDRRLSNAEDQFKIDEENFKKRVLRDIITSNIIEIVKNDKEVIKSVDNKINIMRCNIL